MDTPRQQFFATDPSPEGSVSGPTLRPDPHQELRGYLEAVQIEHQKAIESFDAEIARFTVRRAQHRAAYEAAGAGLRELDKQAGAERPELDLPTTMAQVLRRDNERARADHVRDRDAAQRAARTTY